MVALENRADDRHARLNPVLSRKLFGNVIAQLL
jgi:hypothetical protein